MRYLTKEQCKTNLSLGIAIEQWLSFEKKNDYAILKWLRIDKENNSTYNVSYVECFDDGSDDFVDIYEFSSIDPDEPYIINNFESVNESINFSIDI
jgi:hypothetical protein